MTATSSTSGPPTGAWPTRAGRTRGTGSATPTGPVANAPIALCEVQAYVYGAYLARAHFAREAGDEATFERYRAKATQLKTDFNRDFWLEDQGWFAVGLDADKRPIDSLTSNIGHCLWTGIVDDDKARIVADKLLSPDMFSGWGVRTLARVDGRLQPHQLPLRVGLAPRHGHRGRRPGPLRAHGARRAPDLGAPRRGVALGRPASRALQRPRSRSSSRLPGRLPHVVLAPGVGGGVAAAVPAHHPAPRPVGPLRQDVAGARCCPRASSDLKVAGIPLAGSRVTVEVDGDDVEVTGLPSEIELVQGPRHPSTSV